MISVEQPIFILGDAVFLAETIKNLIDNALKHAGPKLNMITVAITCAEHVVQLTVADDGTGLSPEQKETAFRRFSQVEPSQGSGLGLAIASSVVERHIGELLINRVDVGASLMLSLPRET